MHDRALRRWFWLAFVLLALMALGALYSMIFIIGRYDWSSAATAAVILVVEALLVRSMMKSGRSQ